MSSPCYLWNKTKNEYIQPEFGNSSYKDFRYRDFPRFMVFVIIEKWENNNIIFFPSFKAPKEFKPSFLKNIEKRAQDKTFEYYQEFKKEKKKEIE